MAKRKLSMSLIVLIVAATTLVSGTYAWFLVGGLAELFDLGFGVIEADSGIQIQGSAGTAFTKKGGDSTDWGSYVDRSNFREDRTTPGASDLLAADGKYDPVSSADGKEFHKVGLQGGYFESMTPEKGKDYNDFVVRARSDGETATVAKMIVEFSGSTEAIMAARVSVTVDGVTKIYAVNDGGTQAVVTNSLPNKTVYDTNDNAIMDSGDENFSGAYVSGQSTESASLNSETGKYEAEVALGALPPKGSGSKEIRVCIWIEGNDGDCTGEKLSQKNLTVNVSFKKA